MPRRQKTVEEVTEGSVTLKVYFTPHKRKKPPVQTLGPEPREPKTYPAWTVVHHFGGKRLRRKFTDKALAIAEAKSIARRLSNGQTAVLNMTAADQASWSRAVQILGPVGKPLELVASEYVEALKDLPVPLSDLRKFYLDHHRAGEPLTVPALVARFLQDKRAQNLSESHLKDLETRCERFAKSFTGPLQTVGRDDFRNWLQTLKDPRTDKLLGPRSRNNYRLGLLNLSQFAESINQVPKDWAEFSSVAPAKAERAEIEIWSPAEMRLLLTGAAKAHDEKHFRHDLVPYLAIGAFAGPRSAELCRLDWRRNVKLSTDQIILGCEITKTDRGRQTPIGPNLSRWLRPYVGSSGPICRYKSVSSMLIVLARRVGLTWRHNALRHSFITYRVALLNDVPRVALEAGNSVQEIHDSYLSFGVTQHEARQWFDILPEDAHQNVLALDFGKCHHSVTTNSGTPK